MVPADLVKAVVGLVFLLLATGARADPSPKSSTSGLALAGGLGYQTPFLGAQAAWYQQLSPSLRIAPWVGGGFPGLAGGLMFLAGERHRLVLDLSYGAVGALVSGGTDTATTTRVWYGGSLAAGYEFMADGGFFVRPMLGYSLARDGSRGGTFQLAIGYKLF